MLSAPDRGCADTLRVLEQCEQSLEEYVVKVYAEDADGR